MERRERYGSDQLLLSSSLSQTRKEIPKDSPSRNQELLIRAGYIHQEAAGIYSILPLGVRVMDSIEGIIRNGMNRLGAEEIIMPALQPKSVWDQTGRWNTVEVLFKLKSRWGDKEYALGATNEEIVTPLVKERIKSYKHLPLAVYQMQKKYRDEKRAKSGIIRGREFGMNDMYSFHGSYEDFRQFYEATRETYLGIFAACGINAKVTEASGGAFTKLSTHEFMALSEAGEDTIVHCVDCTFAQNVEISHYHNGEICPKCNGQLTTSKSIEVGHIFELGTKFSDDFGLRFTNKDGFSQPVLMGCYGIGTTRLMGSIVELHNDERGIVWPDSVAPFQCHLVVLDGDREDVVQEVSYIRSGLAVRGVSVLVDDREDVRAGEKFADADLMGIPARIVVSRKTIEKGVVEIKGREETQPTTVNRDEFLNRMATSTK